MDQGKLQQIGTPLEVYDDPANVFVASFIGEPPMNLLHAIIEKSAGGYVFTFPGSNLRIGVPSRYEEVIHPDMRVTLGVRPVDVIIHQNSDEIGTPIPVAIYEDLGDERRISVRIGESLMHLTTTDPIYYDQGELVRLTFNPERTHLFDMNTGARIRPKIWR